MLIAVEEGARRFDGAAAPFAWGVALKWSVFWGVRRGVSGFLSRFFIPHRRNAGKPCFLTLTFASRNPEKQGVSGCQKKHENFFKKPLASKTLF